MHTVWMSHLPVQEWGIGAGEAVMIGDSPKDDVSDPIHLHPGFGGAGAAASPWDGSVQCTILCAVQIVCGNRAGAATILIDELDEHPQLSGEQKPTHRARSMHEVAELLRQDFDLQAPQQR
jgi:FMN phosphatase YigB (HAD superfamily)